MYFRHIIAKIQNAPRREHAEESVPIQGRSAEEHRAAESCHVLPIIIIIINDRRSDTSGPTRYGRGQSAHVRPRARSDDASRPIGHKKSRVQKLWTELCRSESAWPGPSGFGLHG